MAIRGNVGLKVTIDGENKASAALDAASKKVDRLSKATKRTGSASGAAGKGLGFFESKAGKAGIAAAALAAALKVGQMAMAEITRVAEKADKISKTAVGLGLTAQQFQELDFALKMSGGSMEENANAFAKLSRIIRDASEGSAEATKKLGRLGISATDASGAARGPHEVFLELTDAIKEMESDTERTAIALDFFEESGFRLLPFLTQGSEGMAKMAKQAKTVGAVLDQDTVKAANNYTKAKVRLQAATDNLIATWGRPFLGAATGVMNVLSGVSIGVDHTSGRFRSLADTTGDAVNQMAKDTENAASRVIAALRKQAEGAADASVMAGVVAQYDAAVDEVRARAAADQAEVQSTLRDMKRREAEGLATFDRAAFTQLEQRSAQIAAKAKSDIAEIDKARKAEAASILAGIDQEIGQLNKALQISQGRTELEIELAEAASRVASLKAAENQLIKEGKDVTEKLKTEQRDALNTQIDLVEAVKDEKEQRRKKGARARANTAQLRTQGVLMADNLALLRAQLAADGKITLAEKRLLALGAQKVALEKIESDFAEGKITAKKRELLIETEGLKLKGASRRIDLDEDRDQEAKLKKARDLLRDQIAGGEGISVPLNVAFNVDNLLGLSQELSAKGEAMLAQAVESGALSQADSLIARDTAIVQARLDLLEQLGQGLSRAGAMAATSADQTVAAVGRISGALGQQSGNIAKGGSAAISAAGAVAAAVTENVQKQAAIQGAFETAAGFAALAKGNVLGAGIHWTSAGLFFALAATGDGGRGGGGGAATAATQTGPTGGGSEAIAPAGDLAAGTTTIVFNSPIIASDSQEAAAQISDIMSGNDGTGMQGGSV